MMSEIEYFFETIKNNKNKEFLYYKLNKLKRDCSYIYITYQQNYNLWLFNFKIKKTLTLKYPIQFKRNSVYLSDEFINAVTYLKTK